MTATAWPSQWATLYMAWYGPRPFDRDEYIGLLRPTLQAHFEAPQYPAMHYDILDWVPQRDADPEEPDAVTDYWRVMSGPYAGLESEAEAHYLSGQSSPRRPPAGTIVTAMKWNLHTRDGSAVTVETARLLQTALVAVRPSALGAVSYLSPAIRVVPYGDNRIANYVPAAPALPPAPAGVPDAPRSSVPWGIWAALAALTMGALNK